MSRVRVIEFFFGALLTYKYAVIISIGKYCIVHTNRAPGVCRSLQLENNSMAWTYLGVIYLQLGRTHLANRAFKEAQAQEPGYLRGWAGQALVAEVKDSPTVHQQGSQGGT